MDVNVNPQTTKSLLEEIRSQTSTDLDIDGIKIRTCSNVFPPKSEFSRSSEDLHKIFGDLCGTSVLDVGTGTGVQALHAAKRGATRVVAIDHSDEAVGCAKRNVELNNMGDIVHVEKSDLFDAIQGEKFDVIIANLPITDFPIHRMVESALYDPGYVLHRRFFKDASKYLKNDGYIILSHANFNGEGDFENLEKMIMEYGFKVESYVEEQALGYIWRLYRLKI